MFAEPGFGLSRLIVSRRRHPAEVAGVGENIGGDSRQPPPAAVRIGVQPHVGTHAQVGPPQVRVHKPVDLGGNGDLRWYSAAGKVSHVVTRSERLDGEGSESASAATVHS